MPGRPRPTDRRAAWPRPGLPRRVRRHPSRPPRSSAGIQASRFDIGGQLALGLLASLSGGSCSLGGVGGDELGLSLGNADLLGGHAFGLGQLGRGLGPFGLGFAGQLVGFFVGSLDQRLGFVALASQLGCGLFMAARSLGSQSVCLELGGDELFLGGAFGIGHSYGNGHPLCGGLLGELLGLSLGRGDVAG